MDDLSRVMELGFFGVARHEKPSCPQCAPLGPPSHHGDEFERCRGRQICRFVVQRIQTRSDPMPVKPATKAAWRSAPSS
jgi:hypothetical protein